MKDSHSVSVQDMESSFRAAGQRAQMLLWNTFCDSPDGRGYARLYEVGSGGLEKLFMDRDVVRCLSVDESAFDRRFTYGDRYYFVDRDSMCIRSLPAPLADGSPVDPARLARWLTGGSDA